MFLITCHKTDCPTPHFYVNPKGGKIPLIAVLKSPDFIKSIPDIAAAKFAATAEFRLSKHIPEKFTKEEIEIIKEWYAEMQAQIAQNNSGFTFIEEKPEIEDYLIIQCESNHKNYIPLVDEAKSKIKKPDSSES